jgi:hypothetical protein
MIYPAFEAREVTGEALLKDRELMELWKWASNEGHILAVQSGGKNYAVVKDEDLASRLMAFSPSLKRYSFDEATGELR